jgi:phosphohistidine phosphatase
MKTLYLLRHAKSSWADPGMDDRHRSLNARGKQNAPLMGQRFYTREESVDLVLSSPAKRAHDTAKLFAGQCGYPHHEVEVAEALYFLGSGSIEELIKQQGPEVGALMLVFHNPDITSISNSLDYEFHIDNVPTCGLLRFECDIENWNHWSSDKTRFEYFDYPKNTSGQVITDQS